MVQKPVEFIGKIIRVAIYCRVSTDDQEELGTIADQVNYARHFVEERNLVVYDWYLDDGVSGTLPLELRPEGSRLLRDADARRFQVVYCYNMTRWARDTLYYLLGERYLKERSIELRFMRENLDLSNPAGRIQATMLAGFSEYERALILERTMSGRLRVINEGCWVGGQPPYGYKVVPNAEGRRKVLEIFEDEARIVRQMYGWYVYDKWSFDTIAVHLNSMGIPSSSRTRKHHKNTSALWQAATIGKMVHNPVYKGEYVYRKVRKWLNEQGKVRNTRLDPSEHITIAVPAIIPNELWEQAQQQTEANRKAPKASAKREYLLTGVMVCGNCGYPYTGSGGHTRGRMYYKCSSQVIKRVNKPVDCHNRMIRADKVEEAVWSDVSYWLSHPEKMQEMIEVKVKEYTRQVRPIEDELAEIERALSQKHAARKKIRDMFMHEWISAEEAEADLKDLQRQIEGLQQRKQELHSSHQEVEEGQSILVSAQIVLKKLRERIEGAEFKTRKEIVRTIIDKVVVHTGRVEIFYVFTPLGGSANVNR